MGIRCHETSWAGVRLGVVAERADLQFITVEKAGLLDYTNNVFKPGNKNRLHLLNILGMNLTSPLFYVL